MTDGWGSSGSVFSNATGSNNNQKTRFMQRARFAEM